MNPVPAGCLALFELPGCEVPVTEASEALAPSVPVRASVLAACVRSCPFPEVLPTVQPGSQIVSQTLGRNKRIPPGNWKSVWDDRDNPAYRRCAVFS